MAKDATYTVKAPKSRFGQTEFTVAYQRGETIAEAMELLPGLTEAGILDCFYKDRVIARQGADRRFLESDESPKDEDEVPEALAERNFPVPGERTVGVRKTEVKVVDAEMLGNLPEDMLADAVRNFLANGYKVLNVPEGLLDQ